MFFSVECAFSRYYKYPQGYATGLFTFVRPFHTIYSGGYDRDHVTEAAAGHSSVNRR